MIRYISQDDFIASKGIDAFSASAYHRHMLKIRDVRKAQKLTQEDLAAAIGTSQSNVSEIEKGKHNPTLETLSKIADALKVPVADLFDQGGRDNTVSRFLSAYDKLDAAEKLKIVELAELMADRRRPQ